MMLLAEAALRSSFLTAAVWLALKALRARNPHIEMVAWTGALLASLAMPLLMHWAPAETLPVPDDIYDGWPLPPLSGASRAEWMAGAATPGSRPSPGVRRHFGLTCSWRLS